MKRVFWSLMIMITVFSAYGQKKPVKVDGIVAVVGSEAVLQSDIDNMRLQLKEQKMLTKDMDNCRLLEMILQQKLLITEALSDTTLTQTVNREDLREQARQQLKYIKMQSGGLDQVLEMYHKKNEAELLDAITDFNYNQALYNAIKQKITGNVEITPDEVKAFYNNIPKDRLPEFNTQVKLAQIVIRPKPDTLEVQRVVNQLKAIKKAVEKGEKSFSAQAILYSQDPGTRINGGLMTIDKNTPLVKEFKEIAFSLNEGEISEPFKTVFGWHIIKVEKIKGRKRDIRHILLIPAITEKNKEDAKKLLEKIKKRIADGEISFEQAAKEYSEDEETKKRGGLIIDPATNDSYIEITKLPPNIYGQLIGREKGDMTDIIEDRDQTGQIRYILVKILDKIPPHKADFIKDYAKIYQMALDKKKEDYIVKWIDRHIHNNYIYISDEYKKCRFKNKWLQ